MSIIGAAQTVHAQKPSPSPGASDAGAASFGKALSSADTSVAQPPPQEVVYKIVGGGTWNSGTSSVTLSSVNTQNISYKVVGGDKAAGRDTWNPDTWDSDNEYKRAIEIGMGPSTRTEMEEAGNEKAMKVIKGLISLPIGFLIAIS